MFVGNGGSAGIAGHLAIDFAKNGGVRAVTFNDASSLTCLGNDLGYEQIFAKQVEMQAFAGDVCRDLAPLDCLVHHRQRLRPQKRRGEELVLVREYGRLAGELQDWI